MGTTSINSSGPKVAIHELGHSLFELADEYPTGWGRSTSANCDVNTESTGGSACPKWADLQGNAAVEGVYGAVGCQAGCENDAYFVGQTSFMVRLLLNLYMYSS